MNEPPILPPDDGQPPPTTQPPNPPAAATNPYAPDPYASGGNEPQPLPPLASLPSLSGSYWAVVGVITVLLVATCTLIPGLGVPGLLAFISAMVRVPLMRAQPRTGINTPLPSPLLLLLISWIFSLIFGFAALCAFCIVCLPLGFMTLGIGWDSDQFTMPLVFGLSGLIALLCYLFLFRLSLRMSW